MESPAPHIGTLREKPLHAALKAWYQEPGDLVEVAVDGFVIDLVRDELLIEIQTRGFSSMKQKLTRLLADGHSVRIVHPVAVDRWIVKVEETGGVISRRRSPLHATAVDVFSELVSFPELMTTGALAIEVVLTNQEEYRMYRVDGPWRRRGWKVVERRLVEVLDSVSIEVGADLGSLLPEGLPEGFTTADLAAALGRPRRLAQQMAYCLRKAGLLLEVGRRGNAIVYSHAT